MKRIGLALLSSVACALAAVSTASAADLPVRMPVKSPPIIAPAWSWTGCYIGAHAGSGWGDKYWTDRAGGDISDNVSYPTSGFLAGGQAGCDYQVDRIVFGIEGSYSWASIRGDGVPPRELENTTFETRMSGLATLTGRLGFVADRALIYAKGGGVWARERHTVSEFELADEVRTEQLSQSITTNRFGWLFGAGIEYAITNNWSSKIEYNYMDFGDKSYLFERVSEDPVGIRQHLHTIKFGVNYRLNWGPVVAAF
jgi:outer membrane immunogenic protein